MEEQKEIKDPKLMEAEFEMVNSENGEEGEDIQEESEEVEEYDEEEKEQDDSQEEALPVNDEDLIPNKDNFNFQLNNTLLNPLNNDSYNTEQLIEKIIPEIKLNSKNYEEIGLYIYLHFLFRNSYEIFLNSSKSLSHKDIFYFVDKKILVSFDMKKIMKHIIDNSLEFKEDENKDKNKENNKIIFELIKKEINQDDINPVLCCKKKIDKSQKINIIKIILNYNLVLKSMNTKGQHDLFTKIYTMYLFTKNKHLLPIAKSFLKLFSVEKFKPFTKEAYLSYVDKFLKENNDQEINQIIEKDLKDQIKYFTDNDDQNSVDKSIQNYEVNLYGSHATNLCLLKN